MLDACKQEVESAVQAYLQLPDQPVSDLFDYLYEELPVHLMQQRQAALSKAAKAEGE